jgi:hydroxymethylbilane synthase
MALKIRIGTRDSQLAVWQATLVKEQLEAGGHPSELVFVKSEGDIDLVTPLYAIGVQGVFTRTLDAALLGGRIDLAVHSMKDVPVQLARGIAPAAILPRASSKDLMVLKGEDASFLDDPSGIAVIATSSLRRKAQWLHRYPAHKVENLRGNVNTRLKKVAESNWQGAIFAAAGLERIGERPASSIELDWMLPAPAQGAILIVCRQEDTHLQSACAPLNDEGTAVCVNVEREFLSALMGGCSTPVGALAAIEGNLLHFKGNVCSLDGVTCLSEERTVPLNRDVQGALGAAVLDLAVRTGRTAAESLLRQGAAALIQKTHPTVS